MFKTAGNKLKNTRFKGLKKWQVIENVEKLLEKTIKRIQKIKPQAYLEALKIAERELSSKN